MTTQTLKEIEKNGADGRTVKRVAVAGATGFAGQELIRLLARHPNVTITAATGLASIPSTVRWLAPLTVSRVLDRAERVRSRAVS